MSTDNQTPDFSSILNGSESQSPADVAAAVTAAAGLPAPQIDPLTPTPDQQVDPANDTDPADPYDGYPPVPDSEVTAPEPEPTPDPASAPQPDPTPAPQAPADLTPVFTEASTAYKAVTDSIEAAEQAFAEASAALKAAQEGADGIAEYSTDMEALREAKDNAKFAVREAQREAQQRFEEIGDDSLQAAMDQYPELRDDNHPATIAVKNILASNPEVSHSSPTAVAELAVKMATTMRQAAKSSAPAPSQPKPPPGPVPAKAPVPSSAQASHTQAQRPAPGAPKAPDLVAQVQGAASAGSLADLIDQVLGSAAPTIRMS